MLRPLRLARPRVVLVISFLCGTPLHAARADDEVSDARLVAPVDRATIVRAAVSRDVTVRAAEERAQAIELGARAEASLPPPEAMAQVWQVPLARPYALNAQMIMLGVSQSFPAPGSLGAREQAKRAEARAESAMAEDRARGIAREAAIAFVDYAEVTARHRIHREHLAIAQRALDLAEARQSGGGTLADVAQADAERARMEADVVTDGALEASARTRLNAMLARPLDAPLGAPVDEPGTVPAASVPQLVARAGEVRPELKASKAGHEARRQETRAAEREATWPSFSVGALYFAPTQSIPESGYGFNASMSLPWLWGAADRRTGAARAAERAASTAESGAHIAIDGQVATAAAAAESAARRYVVLRDRVLPASRRALDAARSGYEAGRSDVLAVLAAQRAIVDADEALVTTRSALDRAMTELDAAVGEPVKRVPLSGEGAAHE